jgi:hypothetical protein
VASISKISATAARGKRIEISEETSVPFKSEAQRRYFEANKSKLQKQGVDVKEWEESSRGLKLPERAPKTKNNKKSRQER